MQKQERVHPDQGTQQAVKICLIHIIKWGVLLALEPSLSTLRQGTESEIHSLWRVFFSPIWEERLAITPGSSVVQRHAVAVQASRTDCSQSKDSIKCGQFQWYSQARLGVVVSFLNWRDYWEIKSSLEWPHTLQLNQGSWGTGPPTHQVVLQPHLIRRTEDNS